MPELVKSKAVQAAPLNRIPQKNHGVVTLGTSIHLICGRVHEVMGDAADMFAISVAAQTTGPIFWIGWCDHVRSLAPTGAQRFLDSTRIIATSCLSQQEVLWAAEQSLRMLRNGCVIIELNDGPDLKESRRLQIAAEEGGALGIILIARRAQTSAAQTRWICEALPNQETPWVWRLTKNKSGQLGAWRVGWRPRNGGSKDAPDIILMATAVAA